MAKKNILLIDGENILHQSFHKFENLKSTDGRPSGAIFGFFKSLHMYFTRFNPDDVYITFDNGHSTVRTNLLPNYKSHRKNIAVDYESLQEQKKQIRQLLKCLRIKYIFDKYNINNYEGDDFLAYLAIKKFSQDKVTIISSDKDFNQLICKDLKIMNPRKDEIVRENNCMELYGYTPAETVDYLSLVGDNSDDIPGFPGIGPVKARKFLDLYGSIDNFLSSDLSSYLGEGNKNPLLKMKLDNKAIKEMEKVRKRNQKLIDLHWFVDNVKMVKLPLYNKDPKKEMDLKKFKEICITYSLSSFMTKTFIEVFENLKK